MSNAVDKRVFVVYTSKRTCPACDGAGSVRVYDVKRGNVAVTCPHCYGKREVKR